MFDKSHFIALKEYVFSNELQSVLTINEDRQFVFPHKQASPSGPTEYEILSISIFSGAIFEVSLQKKSTNLSTRHSSF